MNAAASQRAAATWKCADCAGSAGLPDLGAVGGSGPFQVPGLASSLALLHDDGITLHTLCGHLEPFVLVGQVPAHSPAPRLAFPWPVGCSVWLLTASLEGHSGGFHSSIVTHHRRWPPHPCNHEAGHICPWFSADSAGQGQVGTSQPHRVFWEQRMLAPRGTGASPGPLHLWLLCLECCSPDSAARGFTQSCLLSGLPLISANPAPSCSLPTSLVLSASVASSAFAASRCSPGHLSVCLL